MIFRHRPLPPTLIVCLTVLLLSAAVVSAQTTAARPDRGRMPNGSYAVSDIENISLDNGNVNLNIPLASLPPIAGGKLSWTLNAQYNSKIWDVIRTQAIGQAFDLSQHYYVVDSVQQSDRGGWRIAGQYQMEIRNARADFNYQLPPVADPDYSLMVNNEWYKVMMIMPDGSEHELRPLDYSPFAGGKEFLYGYYKENPSAQGTMRYYSYDGSYLFATITSSGDWTVYLPDGTKVTETSGIQRIQDTNGNKIKIFTDTNGTHYQDELTSREIRYLYDPSLNGGLGQGKIFYKTVGGTDEEIDINFGTTTIQGQLYQVNDWVSGQLSEEPCTHKALLSRTIQVVREIVLPRTEPTGEQRRFTFNYNSDDTESASTSAVRFTCTGSVTTYTRNASKGWGALSKVTTPSGAEIQYAYGLDAGNPFAHSVLSTDDIAGETITKKTLVHDGTSDAWNYVIGENGGTQTYLADGSVVEELKYPQATAMGTGFGGPWNGLTGLSYRSTRPFSKTERHWTNLRFSGVISTSPGGALTFNPVVDAEYTTLTDAAGNALRMSARTMQYDYNGNVTQTKEYDWFDPSLVTNRDSYGIPAGVPPGLNPVRVTNNSYYNAAPSDTSANVYARRSISTGVPLILNAPQQTTLGSSIVQFSYDGQPYGTAPTVGNLTTKKAWDDVDSKWITTSNTYDVYGNVATATDGRGKTTTFTYGDSTHALPTSVTVDPQNSTGIQTSYTAYDTSTGLVTSQTDVNGQISTINYTNQLLGSVDPFGRPGYTEAPQININGTPNKRRVTTTYKDSARQMIVEADLNAQNDKLLKTQTTTDMLGRPVLTEQTEDGSTYTISVTNAYLNMGSVTLTSSARRSAESSTDSWTRVTKDAAGRVKEVATFGGPAQPAWTATSGVFTGAVTTTYDAEFTTVTDQAGKVRRSMVDALGRLTRVDEPDGSGNLGTTSAATQPTGYAYDVFGNLLTVTQSSQTRSFTYDSLSRLRTAVNPESGTVSYQYDDNGNLVVKTDARGVSTHFDYDSINRLTRRWYNGSTSTSSTTHNSPALPSGVGATDEARFYYDSQSLPSGAPTYTHGSTVGRMVAQVYGSGSNGDYYAYDVLGRQTLKIQQTSTVNYQLSASYTLSGAISTLTYPSGHTVNNSFDQAGRLTGFSGNLGDGNTRTYATGILYSPIGGLVTEQFGTYTPVYNKLFYNSRGQLAEIRESTTSSSDTSWNRGAIINHYSNQCWGMCFGSSMTDNNGNLQKQEVYIPNDDQVSGYTQRWQQYDYDSLNRLNWAREIKDGTEQWKQQFTYDRWGNRTINTGVTYGVGINNQAFTVNTSNNRLAVPSGQSGTMSYDAAGNLTNDTYTGAGNRTYDGENKITSAWGGNNQAQLYAYDASGQRIKRTVNGIEMWQVYGFGGELVAEYAANGPASSPQKEYGYRNDQLLVTADLSSAGPVAWTSVVGVTVSGNSLSKPGADGWDAGAVSTQTINSGDGYVEVTATETNKHRRIGLSNGNSNQNWDDIDFCIYLEGSGTVYINEGPTPRGSFGSYSSGDVFRVAVEGGVVKYRKNGALLYTSTIAPTYPLLVDTALYSSGATLTNVVMYAASAANIQWLITDQLGTPRMVFDQTGALNNVKRHDYLPFGEELFAPVSGRAAVQGYAGGDGVRQHFTAKERDVETGLDYFGARYYGSTQGRFSEVDPYELNFEHQENSDRDEAEDTFKDYVRQPQHWNHYSYTLNNPLRYVDPDGMKDEEYNLVLLDKKIKIKISDKIEKADREKIKERLNGAIARINAGAGKLTTEEKKAINKMNGIEVRGDIVFSFTNTNNKVFNMMPSSVLIGSLDSLTGAIIHDSFHSDQAQRGLSFEGEKNLVDREREAYSFAADVAEKIGLETAVIEWLRNDSKVYQITPSQSPNRSPYKKPSKKRP